jgi:hypothetical protein
MATLPADDDNWIHEYKGHIVMHLISELPTRTLEKLIGFDKDVGRTCPFDVKLTINGHEFDFDRFAVHVQQQMERMINEAAAELIKDKFESMTEDVFSMMEEAKQVMRNKLIDVIKHDPWGRR